MPGEQRAEIRCGYRTDPERLSLFGHLQAGLRR
jgi:hypothetical protein